ncbi:e3 ubiquitin-protein ligase bre1 [Anaeramoeba flamelloides]|uniref:E3 ubiquitin protein ligase n=1 Tax=Anaeramoeba flamelloides TaxID=1746091 RepID=A0AAV7ZDG3_9EUKA|nr:e3 ubiquitin-protein ligase bre1 [Anaeramoeba flamelloides]
MIEEEINLENFDYETSIKQYKQQQEEINELNHEIEELNDQQRNYINKFEFVDKEWKQLKNELIYQLQKVSLRPVNISPIKTDFLSSILGDPQEVENVTNLHFGELKSQICELFNELVTEVDDQEQTNTKKTENVMDVEKEEEHKGRSPKQNETQITKEELKESINMIKKEIESFDEESKLVEIQKEDFKNQKKKYEKEIKNFEVDLDQKINENGILSAKLLTKKEQFGSIKKEADVKKKTVKALKEQKTIKKEDQTQQKEQKEQTQFLELELSKLKRELEEQELINKELLKKIEKEIKEKNALRYKCEEIENELEFLPEEKLSKVRFYSELQMKAALSQKEIINQRQNIVRLGETVNESFLNYYEQKKQLDEETQKEKSSLEKELSNLIERWFNAKSEYDQLRYRFNLENGSDYSANCFEEIREMIRVKNEECNVYKSENTYLSERIKELQNWLNENSSDYISINNGKYQNDNVSDDDDERKKERGKGTGKEKEKRKLYIPRKEKLLKQEYFTIQNLEEFLELLNSEILDRETEISKQKDLINSLIKNIENIGKSCAETGELKNIFTKKINEKDDAIIKHVSDQNELNISKQKLDQENEQLKLKISEITNKFTESVTRLNQLNIKINELETHNKKLYEESLQITTTLERERQESNDLFQNIKILESHLDQAKLSHQYLTQKVNSITSNINDEKMKNDQMIEEIKQLAKKEIEIKKLKELKQKQQQDKLQKRKDDYDEQKNDDDNDENEEQKLLNYQKMVKCFICDRNLKSVILKNCHHTFCNDCINERLRLRLRSCPLCSTKFTKEDIKPFFLNSEHKY